jgi:hypothetical protein
MLEISDSGNMPTDLTLSTDKKNGGIIFDLCNTPANSKKVISSERISDQRSSHFSKNKVRRKFVNPHFIKNETILRKTTLPRFN